MIRAILFDMDGVLIDAKDWHYEALNRALDLFGYQISRYDHLTVYDGLPTKQKLELLTLERGLPRKLHGFIAEMKQAYTVELIHSRCRPTFVHEYALSRLKCEGYKLAVGSNSIRSTIQLMLSKAELLRYFDVVLSNEDVVHAKPSPEIYEKLILHFGLHPSECLVVEDNPKGVKAAVAAGAHVMEVEGVTDVNYSAIVKCIESKGDRSSECHHTIWR